MNAPRLARTGLGIGLLSVLLLPVAIFTPLVAVVPLLGAALGAVAIARLRAPGTRLPVQAWAAVAIGLILAVAMVTAYLWIGAPLQALLLGGTSSP